jgi:hypothetical protein
MPEGYITGGNSRVFYMLKSYTLKVLDTYHNEVLRQMKTDPVQGAKNFVKLSATLVLMGATTDWIKDFLLGKTGEISDYMMNNILKTAGFNKYFATNAQKEGLINALFDSLMPPAAFVDDALRDAIDTAKGKRDISEWRIWSSVPYVGKFYYWWFGGGKRSKGSFQIP